MRLARWLPLVGVLALPSQVAALQITILEPPPGEPVFGEVAFRAEILPQDEILLVEFLVDGRSVARRSEPPFRVTADVGQENRGHRFEVVAESRGGQIVTAVVETPAIPVDHEVSVELRQLYVTATRGDERVLDLGPEEFTVLDDGVRQRLVTFARGDVPFTAVLLLDVSASMRGARLAAVVSGARTFAGAMKPLDQCKVLLFSDRLLHSTPFTSFPQIVTAGLAGIEASGGTALNDHLYMALRLLERRQGRRLVVLLSDGVDVESILRMHQLLEVVRRSRSLIYWIRLGATDPQETRHSAWRDAAEHRRELELLERAVATSGGRIETLGSIADSEAAFEAVMAEIREQYVLGYYPSHALGNGQWHRVTVRVARPGVRVRARAGYLGD